MTMIKPVIMAGGSGTRLWPLSRRMLPKQFLALTGEQSMLQETLQRLQGLDRAPAIVVCNEEHRFLVAEQFLEINERNSTIILEPAGRNTAPAIAVAALKAIQQAESLETPDNQDDKHQKQKTHDNPVNTKNQKNSKYPENAKTLENSEKSQNPVNPGNQGDPLLLVLSADHVIADQAAFHNAIKQATSLALDNHLVTFGIVPTAAETGYGYIHRGAKVGGGFKVTNFVEKPDSSTAEQYIASGDYYWNSGMFMFRAQRYIDELKQFCPDILAACQQAVDQGAEDLDFFRLDKDVFLKSPSDSVDYAVMEKTDSAVVVPLDAGWNDIGNWSALWDINEKDSQNNATRGDTILFETTECLVHAESRLVTTFGIDNLVVIETKDAVLVADKSQAQNVKEIVDDLREKNRFENQYHRVVYRPWGSFDCIEEGHRFKVKRITVKPGASSSLQKHHHRSEHWVIVSGTARVTKGDKIVDLTENESIYIEAGEIHAIANPGVIPLDLIEVQTGSYLGEDDIVRYDDLYGREDK